MTHLIAIAVGPVQEFIAAARRTRDLWFGSYLLSEISRAVAESVEASGGRLIFPAACDAENVANVILAELPTGDPKDVAAKAEAAPRERNPSPPTPPCDPKDVAAKAKVAVLKRWHDFATETQRIASGVIRQDIWDEQVDDVIEFYAAWVASSPDYKLDRQTLMRLLAGRKNCRDFLPAKGRAGVLKSSLDGQRESVLKPPTAWPTRFRARLRLREGEQLDVVGLVKRHGGGKVGFPSVSRIAADPWVRGNATKPAFAELIAACEDLPGTVLHRLDATQFKRFQAFRFEGTAVYRERHHEWELEVDIEDHLALGELQDALSQLPEPSPYLAVLVADGDKMGAAISILKDAKDNRAFSTALAGFATEARRIVDHYNGVLVYAGGDDVLAFVPVDKCLMCARDLREAFVACLKVQVPHDTPTLSVGLAIGHFMDNLEDLLEFGRAAEKASKLPDRDGLAVHLHKRGGSPITMRSQWGNDPDGSLTRFAELLLIEAIPGKLPYDLRKLAEVYTDWPKDTLVAALRADVIRVIRDKQPKAGRTYMKEIEEILSKRLTDAVSLYRFSEELLIAKQIAVAMKQAGHTVSAETIDKVVSK